MPPAATRFIAITELLICLGDVISNRRLLLDLCLTSKSFNAAFTPFLYEELWFDETNADFLLNKHEILLTNSALKHTKLLDFWADPDPDPDPDVWWIKRPPKVRDWRLFNKAIRAIVSKTPNLTNFSWENLPLFATTISTLHNKCPNLRSLSISHHIDIEKFRGPEFESDHYDFHSTFTKLRPLFQSQDFSPFANLRELEIHEIHGDLTQATSDIVKVLIASPDLRTLSLSLNSETAAMLADDEMELEPEQYRYFLKTLISEFVAAGGRPLSLRKLVLGLSVILWEEDRHQPAMYLGGLADLSKLEEVYICNCEIFSLLHFGSVNRIAWCTFVPEICPSLNILGLHDCTPVEGWIKGQELGFLGQLRVGYPGTLNMSEFRNFLDASDRHHGSMLRMLTFECVSSKLLKKEARLPLEIPGPHALSFDLSLPSPNSKPTLLTCISKYQSLQQLCILNCRPLLMSKSEYISYEQYLNNPNRQTFLGEDGRYDALGQEIAATARELRYLKLDKHAWRIWRNNDGEGEDRCRLEKLDRFEQRAVEAFKQQRTFEPNESE